MRVGWWQKRVLLECEEPYNPLRDLAGNAKNWSSSYYRSLRSLEDRGLLEAGPWGPRGGKAWKTTEKGKELLTNQK